MQNPLLLREGARLEIPSPNRDSFLDRSALDLLALSELGGLAGYEEADDEAEQSEDGAENLNNKNPDEPASVLVTHHKLF